LAIFSVGGKGIGVELLCDDADADADASSVPSRWPKDMPSPASCRLPRIRWRLADAVNMYEICAPQLVS
jgi:hypothetical protein